MNFRVQSSEFRIQNSVGGYDIREIEAPDGYKAAVAAEGEIGSIDTKTLEIL
jgi:hypothetical protein